MKHKRFSLGTRIRIIKKKLKQVWLYPHRPHTQQLRHASYKLLKTIAVNVVSSDQGGQGSFLAKNLNDLTALKTNLFQLFVCILQAWGNEGEALNYVKLWKEKKEKKTDIPCYKAIQVSISFIFWDTKKCYLPYVLRIPIYNFSKISAMMLESHHPATFENR